MKKEKNENVIVDFFSSYNSFDLLLVFWMNNHHYHKIFMTVLNLQLTVILYYPFGWLYNTFLLYCNLFTQSLM